MTVTIDQAMRGAMRYADNEVIPHLPGGKGIGAGIMLALIMEGSREKILALRENPAVKMMQIFDDTITSPFLFTIPSLPLRRVMK